VKISIVGLDVPGQRSQYLDVVVVEHNVVAKRPTRVEDLSRNMFVEGLYELMGDSHLPELERKTIRRLEHGGYPRPCLCR
jgi:hypothetical protein